MSFRCLSNCFNTTAKAKVQRRNGVEDYFKHCPCSFETTERNSGPSIHLVWSILKSLVVPPGFLGGVLLWNPDRMPITGQPVVIIQCQKITKQRGLEQLSDATSHHTHMYKCGIAEIQENFPKSGQDDNPNLPPRPLQTWSIPHSLLPCYLKQIK